MGYLVEKIEGKGEKTSLTWLCGITGRLSYKMMANTGKGINYIKNGIGGIYQFHL